MAKAKVVAYTGSIAESYGPLEQASCYSISITFAKRPKIMMAQVRPLLEKIEKLVTSWQPK